MAERFLTVLENLLLTLNCKEDIARSALKKLDILKLENTNLFTLKEGKRLLKKLKKEEFISDTFLTLKGELIAKNVEQEFKI